MSGKNSQPAFWRPDESTKKCELCQKDFGVFRRKHHCRSCGGVFCDSCTKGREVVVDDNGTVLSAVRVCDTPECVIRRASAATCEQGCKLTAFDTPVDGYTCSMCDKIVRKGTLLFGCRNHNFDFCSTCYHRAPNMQSGSGKGPALAGPPPNAVSATAATCKHGCKLTAFDPGDTNLDSYLCDGYMCKKIVKKGTSLFGCRNHDFDLCSNCYRGGGANTQSGGRNASDMLDDEEEDWVTDDSMREEDEEEEDRDSDWVTDSDSGLPLYENNTTRYGNISTTATTTTTVSNTQSGSGKGPALAGPPPNTVPPSSAASSAGGGAGAKRLSAGTTASTTSSAATCEQGCKLTAFDPGDTNLDSYLCDGYMCKKIVKKGTSLFGCRNHDFDLCSNCYRRASSKGPPLAVPPPNVAPPSSAATFSSVRTILECRSKWTDGKPEYLIRPPNGDDRWDSLSGYTGNAIAKFEAATGVQWTCQHCDTVHQYTLTSCPGCKESRDTAAVTWEVTLGGGETAKMPVIVAARLEAALKKGDTTVDHWMHNDNKRFNYTFDLKAMEQKNNDSNQVRSLKRVPASSASPRLRPTPAMTILEQRTDLSDGKPQYLVRLQGADETWESLSNYSGSAITDFEASPRAKWTCQFCDMIHQYNKITCPRCSKSRKDAAVQWTVLLDGGKEAVLSVVVTTLLEETRKNGNQRTTVDHWMRNPPHNEKFDYTFDVKKMEQLNKTTNVTRSLKRKAISLYVVLDARPASDDGKQLEYLLQKHGEDPSWVADSDCPVSTLKDFRNSSRAKWTCSTCSHAVMSYTKETCNACSRSRDDCAVKWYVEIDGGERVPLPVSVSTLLDDATRTGKSTCKHWMFTAKKFNYTFDLAKMEQKNLESGKSRNIHRDPVLKQATAQAMRKQTQLVRMVVSLQGLYRVASEYARTRGFPIPLINPVALTNNAGDKFQAALTSTGYQNINELLNMGAHYTVGFHGTDTADAIVGIFNTGFDPARRGSNGQVHGPGEYFDISTNAGVATQYHGATKCLIVSIIILLHKDGKKNPLYSEACFSGNKDLPIAIVNNPKSDAMAFQIPVAVVSNCPTTDAVVNAVKETYADELDEINQYL